MVRVAFLELETHQNILYILSKIATTGGDDVTVFTTELIAESVRTELGAEASDITWIEKDDDESLRSYLRRVERHCERIDVLLVQPLYGGYRKLFTYATFDPPCDRALTVFNARLWLEASYSLGHRPLHNLNIALRRRIVDAFDALVVEYPPIADYVTSIGVDTPVYTLSPTLFEDEQCIPDGPVRFTVPGFIESDRRDYDIVLDVFADLFEQFGDGVELQLLGTPKGEYGKRILDRCDEFADAGHRVITYREWIPLDEFETGLRHSHFLLCPLRSTITNGPVEERYGTTKGSGNVSDAIRTATPLIVPAHFAVADGMADATVTYDDRDDMCDSLEMLVCERDRRTTLYDRALETARVYTRERQYERFSRVMAGISDRETN
jgi:hypothetical protein